TSLLRILRGEKFNPQEPTTHGLKTKSLKIAHPTETNVRGKSFPIGSTNSVATTPSRGFTEREPSFFCYAISGQKPNRGHLSTNRRTVAQNYQEAVRWYRKAAEQGDAKGQSNLGLMYHYGLGVAQN
ncbi:MAG: hypothetical protein ABFS56_10555, partial [Pseudomonadota bacterium]